MTKQLIFKRDAALFCAYQLFLRLLELGSNIPFGVGNGLLALVFKRYASNHLLCNLNIIAEYTVVPNA